MSWESVDNALADLKEKIARSAVQLRRQAREGSFSFKPFSAKQKKVLTWWCPGSPVRDADGIIADGSIRSGKTLCMSLSFVFWAMSLFSGQSFAICGKTIGSLRRNVVFWLRIMLRCRGYAVEDHRTDNLLTVQRGDIVNYFYLFGGKDERSQDLIQGITLAGVLFDEVALMPQSFVEQATARCSVTGSKWWFNCNPEGPFHWFYCEWIQKAAEKNVLYLHFTMDDNLSLSPAIKARYESQYSGVFYLRFILGRWVIAEGLVYQMFAEEPEKFTIKGPLRIDGQFFVSIDYGTINPFSMGLWCISGDVAVRIKEWYFDSRKQGRQMTDEEYYQQLEEFVKGYYIRRVVVDPSAASFIECIRRHGRFSIRPAENSVLDGIRVTSSLLAGGRVKIHESCIDALREFSVYCWDETHVGGDAVVKANDHAMDDIRYFCATILSREFRWIDWVRR